MPVQLDPYLNFADGKAREAMEFYQSVFGGELHVATFGEQPDFPGKDASIDDLVMHSQLGGGDHGLHLMAADAVPGMAEPNAGSMQLSLSGDDETLLRGYWDRLLDGGSVTVPLDQAPWGDIFGMLTDRFGVPWMVNILGPDQG